MYEAEREVFRQFRTPRSSGHEVRESNWGPIRASTERDGILNDWAGIYTTWL